MFYDCTYEHRHGLKTKDMGIVLLQKPSSAGSHGTDYGVTEPGHGRPSCQTVLLVVTWPTAAAMLTARRKAAGESAEQSLAEAHVHEAVDNWVDASRGVAQQMDECNGRPREGTFGGDVIKSPPGVNTVQRHPAEKEQNNDDHQHTYDSLLGLQIGSRCVAAGSVYLHGLG